MANPDEAELKEIGRKFHALFRKITRLRLSTRWTIIRAGVGPAVFWTFVLIIATWAVADKGWMFVFYLALMTWGLLMLPTLYVESAILADFANYLFTRQAHVIRQLKFTRDSPPADRELQELLLQSLSFRIFVRAAKIAGRTSPLSCFAIWALVVLLRARAGEHTPDVTNDEPIVRKVRWTRDNAEHRAVLNWHNTWLRNQ